MPIPEIYNKDGQLIEGAEGYSKGFVADIVKRCDAILDENDRLKKTSSLAHGF